MSTATHYSTVVAALPLSAYQAASDETRALIERLKSPSKVIQDALKHLSDATLEGAKFYGVRDEVKLLRQQWADDATHVILTDVAAVFVCGEFIYSLDSFRTRNPERPYNVCVYKDRHPDRTLLIGPLELRFRQMVFFFVRYHIVSPRILADFLGVGGQAALDDYFYELRLIRDAIFPEVNAPGKSRTRTAVATSVQQEHKAEAEHAVAVQEECEEDYQKPPCGKKVKSRESPVKVRATKVLHEESTLAYGETDCGPSRSPARKPNPCVSQVEQGLAPASNLLASNNPNRRFAILEEKGLITEAYLRDRDHRMAILFYMDPTRLEKFLKAPRLAHGLLCAECQLGNLEPDTPEWKRFISLGVSQCPCCGHLYHTYCKAEIQRKMNSFNDVQESVAELAIDDDQATHYSSMDCCRMCYRNKKSSKWRHELAPGVVEIRLVLDVPKGRGKDTDEDDAEDDASPAESSEYSDGGDTTRVDGRKKKKKPPATRKTKSRARPVTAAAAARALVLAPPATRRKEDVKVNHSAPLRRAGKLRAKLPCPMETNFACPLTNVPVKIEAQLWYVDSGVSQGAHEFSSIGEKHRDEDSRDLMARVYTTIWNEHAHTRPHLQETYIILNGFPVRRCFFHRIMRVTPSWHPYAQYVGRWFSSPYILDSRMDLRTPGWSLLGEDNHFTSLNDYDPNGFENVYHFSEAEEGMRDFMATMCQFECREDKCGNSMDTKHSVCEHDRQQRTVETIEGKTQDTLAFVQRLHFMLDGVKRHSLQYHKTYEWLKRLDDLAYPWPDYSSPATTIFMSPAYYAKYKAHDPWLAQYQHLRTLIQNGKEVFDVMRKFYTDVHYVGPARDLTLQQKENPELINAAREWIHLEFHGVRPTCKKLNLSAVVPLVFDTNILPPASTDETCRRIHQRMNKTGLVASEVNQFGMQLQDQEQQFKASLRAMFERRGNTSALLASHKYLDPNAPVRPWTRDGSGTESGYELTVAVYRRLFALTAV